MQCYIGFIIASPTVARHFWCISLLGSLQNTILLLCMHAQKHVRRIHSLLWHCVAPRTVTRLWAHTAHSRYVAIALRTLAFLKKTGRSWNTKALLFLGHMDTWPWLCKNVTANTAIVSSPIIILLASDHTPQQLCYIIAWHSCCSSTPQKITQTSIKSN